jgi:hypothetical protein
MEITVFNQVVKIRSNYEIEVNGKVYVCNILSLRLLYILQDAKNLDHFIRILKAMTK